MHKCPGLKLRGEWLGYLCVDYHLLHSASPQGLSFDSNTWSVASSILLFLAILGHFLQDFFCGVVKTETAFVFSDGSLVAHSAIVLVAGRDLNVLF